MSDEKKRKVNFTKVPFNFSRSRTRALCHRELGEHEVPEDMADAAVKAGAAEEITKTAATKPASK